MQEGWLCPRCKKVNAPWVPQCSCFDFQDKQITCSNIYDMAINTSSTQDKEK